MNYTLESICNNIVFEDVIQSFIKDKFNENQLYDHFPNPIIKENTLDLLDRFCTVVYFPLENESNNGFHVNDMPMGEEMKTFVFVNTAQTMEKQVFTAAHELGHIWNIDKFITDKYSDKFDLSEIDSEDLQERIINRFAAILLMPGDIFKRQFKDEKNKYTEDGRILVDDFLKLIVSLMVYFYAPFKSVIKRMLELKLVSDSIADTLLVENDKIPNNKIDNNKIDNRIKELLESLGGKNFVTPSNKKMIRGLPELLSKAEESKSAPANLILQLRKKFDMTESDFSEQYNNFIYIS